MNKQISSYSLAAIAAIVLFSACSKKSNTLGRYVPQNAAVVMHINGAALNEKLPWAEIKDNEWFKEMQADTSMRAFAKTVLDNPDNSGVDVKKDFVIFYINDTTGSYATIQGSIIDAAKFKIALKEGNKNGAESTKEAYTYFVDDKTCVAYNKEKFFATMAVANYNSLAAMPPMLATDSTYTEQKPIVVDVTAKTTALIALAEDKTLAKNEKFSELVATKGDAHLWMSAEYLNNTQSMGSMMAMANLSKLYKGAITTATLNFNNGKIDIDIKSYAGKEMTELYEKYGDKKLDKTLLQNIPSSNVAAVMALSFKPEGVKAFLKVLSMDGLINLGAAQAGFNLDDFIKANKGDILFAVSDLDTSDAASQKMPNILFATTIGDKASFNKLIDAGKKYGSAIPGDMSKMIHFNVNDKYFAMSSNKAYTEKFLAGNNLPKATYIDKISDGSFGGYVNFQYIINNIKKSTDTLTAQEQNLSLKMWDNLIINGGDYSNKKLTQHWEINLVDKNTNSLKQLNKYGGQMAAIETKKRAIQDAYWKNEDVQFTAPVVEENK